MIKQILFITVLFTIMGCKSISVANETQRKTTQSIELGVIGEDKVFVLEEDYNSIAIPFYNKPIKVGISVLSFKNSSYKAFVKANSKKSNPLQIMYIDSIANKPKFLKLELADRVTVLNALNEKQNKDVKHYVLNKKDTHVISAISIALDDARIKSITEADALFLEQDSNKNYILKAYKNEELIMSLSFTEGVVFAYQASNFCWQENDQSQLEIVDIVESTDKCPNNTYRSAKRAKKKVDYFKF